jgi:membrane protein DedA with SNARE-associated domain
MLSFDDLISSYGLFVVAGMIGVECIGLPVPGETILVAASIFAGTGHGLNIYAVISVAIAGAFVGNLVGYLIGRDYGYWLLLNYGRYIKITEARIKLGQYLFLRHGGKIVLIARFVPVLRSVGGILAGANRMRWQPFLVANIVGAVAWAVFYGVAAYILGKEIERMAGPVAVVLGAVVVITVVAAGMFVARHEERLIAEAEQALPGPLQVPRSRRRS